MKHILVPTDFSAVANNATRYAIQFARVKGFHPVFFHSAHSIRNMHQYMEDHPSEYEKEKKRTEAELQRNIMAQYKKLGFKPGKIKVLVKLGESFEGCLAEALVENKIAMIIMGTHGETNLKDKIMGSNASHVIATSPVPVLCVPARVRYNAVKELIYFTDLSHVKEELKKIKGFGRLLRSKIEVVHFDYSWARTGEEEKLLKRLAASSLNFHNSKVSIDIPFLDHIKRYTRNKNALPCLFHDKKNALVKLLTGSNPEEAPTRIHAPILSIQRAA